MRLCYKLGIAAFEAIPGSSDSSLALNKAIAFGTSLRGGWRGRT